MNKKVNCIYYLYFDLVTFFWISFVCFILEWLSKFENWGVGIAKLTLNLQFDCFVTHLHMFSCLFSFDLNFG